MFCLLLEKMFLVSFAECKKSLGTGGLERLREWKCFLFLRFDGSGFGNGQWFYLDVCNFVATNWIFGIVYKIVYVIFNCR